MTATRRWALVALGTLLLVAGVAVGPRLVPARADPIDAGHLLGLVQSSGPAAYSGMVETDGRLGLPLTDQFSDLAGLLGGQNRLRVWWAGANAWRVDQLTLGGETDQVHDADGTTTWDYESHRATRTGPAVVRLPQPSDLLPPELARLMLESATPSQVSRLAARRIAGQSAPGLRYRPADGRTSISRVDVWADAASGIPLQVEVYAAGASGPALTSSFDTFSPARPSAALTSFDPAPDVRTRFEPVTDLAAAANAYAPVVAPPTLGGLARRASSTGAVGIYGLGVTEVFALPLPGRIAIPLRRQLQSTVGVAAGAGGDLSLSAPPLNLLLTSAGDRGRSWLLAGTVTPAFLVSAAGELAQDDLAVNQQAAVP